MKKILIIDNQFEHGSSFGTGWLNIGPDNFNWKRNYHNKEEENLIIFTESGMDKYSIFPNIKKIGIILEPREIYPSIYERILDPNFHNKFKYILTHDEILLKTNPKVFKFYTFGGCWIFPKDQKLYNKSNNISIIASSKTWTIGHRLRHEVIKKYDNLIDGKFGSGYKYVKNKIEALKDFRFSIVIENSKKNNYFTEKIIDCIKTGTIPIYWGCNNIDKFLNPKGIITFKEIEDLDSILKNCTESLYEKMLPYAIENFYISNKYIIPENNLWDNYFSKELIDV